MPYHDIDQYNLFTYCYNNPINDKDDDGQLSWLAKIAIGAIAIVIGVGVTALTGGAALPAIAAGAKAALISGAISAGTSATITAVKSVNSGDDLNTTLKKSAASAIDSFADGFMAGGIMAGGSQILSSGFKVAAKAGVATGRNGGLTIGNKIRVLSPNSLQAHEAGGTLLKIGSKYKNIRFDVGCTSLFHMNIQLCKTANYHLPIGIFGSGLWGGTSHD